MKTLAPALILCGISLNLFSATYYVKVGGGTGSGLDDANAWSYAKFNSTPVAAGSIVRFKRGETFYGSFSAWPGSSGNNVKFGTYGTGSDPIISGFTTLSGWTLYEGTTNIWYCTLNTNYENVQIVTVDGVIKKMGRYPNTGWLTYTGTNYNPAFPGTPATNITGSTVSSLPFSFVGGEVVIKKHRYIIDRHFITGQSGSTLTFNNTNWYGQNQNNFPTPGNGYFIQGNTATLDQEGEWAYDKPNNRFYYVSSVNPSSKVIRVSTVNQLVPFNSSGYTTFDSLKFEGALYAFYNNYSSNITINDCNIEFCGIGIYGDHWSNSVVNRGSIKNCTTNGVFGEIANSNISFKGVYVRDIGLIPGANESGDGKNNGMGVAGNYITFSDCEIRNIGFNGIAFEGDYDTITHCLVDTFDTVKDDGGGLYTFTQSGETRVGRYLFENTVLHGIGAPDGAGANEDPNGEAAGIYLDGNSNHTTLYKNNIGYCGWIGIFVNANSYHTISSNTTFDCGLGFAINQISLSGPGSARNLVVSDNVFCALNNGQFPMQINFMSVSDNPPSVGTFTNNVYAKPINTNSSIRLIRSYPGGNGINDYTVPVWKTTYSMDVGSNPSSTTTTNVSDIIFKYNHSYSNSIQSLPYIYKDVKNASLIYNGSITLSPFSSSAMVYSSAIVTGNQNGKVIVTPNGEIQITPDGKTKIHITIESTP